MSKVRPIEERLKELDRKKQILEAQKTAREAMEKVRKLRGEKK